MSAQEVQDTIRVVGQVAVMVIVASATLKVFIIWAQQAANVWGNWAVQRATIPPAVLHSAGNLFAACLGHAQALARGETQQQPPPAGGPTP